MEKPVFIDRDEFFISLNTYGKNPKLEIEYNWNGAETALSFDEVENIYLWMKEYKERKDV